MDRRKLLEQQNALRNQLQIDELTAAKAGVDPVTRTQMRKQALDKIKQMEIELGDDLQKLNQGEAIRFNKIGEKLGNAKSFIKKLPLAGVGIAALSGDPAMAAEELAQDAAGPIGLAYEAVRPEVAGNVEEESQMLAERDAMKNYEDSPAGQAAKFSRIKSSLGIK